MGLKRGGLLLSLLVLPLYVPTLIFGAEVVKRGAAGLSVEAPLLRMSAITLGAAAALPFAAAAPYQPAVASPQVVNDDGTPQWSGRHFPTVGHQTEDAFQKTAFAATIRANQGMNLPWRNLPVERFKNLRTAQLQGKPSQMQCRAAWRERGHGWLS